MTLFPALSVSILDADLLSLKDSLSVLEKSRAVGSIHLDVMDGHFVPNLTLGPKVAKDLKAHTSLPIRAHLMVSNPDHLLEPFAQAGVSAISVHQEACPHLHRTLSAIHALGLKAGVALNPATPVCTLEEVLPIADFVLIMSVNPGFGGQGFIPEMLEKIQKLKRLLQGTPRHIRVAVDGGIKATNAADVVKAGADTLIVGSSLFAESLPLGGALETFEEVFTGSGTASPEYGFCNLMGFSLLYVQVFHYWLNKEGLMLQDRLGRELRDLRISVTDRCNFRCVYCIPEKSYVGLDRSEILRLEEIERLAKIFLRLGVRDVKLTGGEPLVRKGVGRLIARLCAIQGLEDLSLTTNGSLLEDHAKPLFKAGLRRLNISLDTLDNERFRAITARGSLESVLDGIFAAKAVGFSPT